MAGSLEKALTESLKEKNCVIGSRSVLNEIKKSKLVVVSKSATPKIAQLAQESSVPVVQFEGSSVALSKMCGRHYRISALSFTKLAAATIKTIMGESEKE